MACKQFEIGHNYSVVISTTVAFCKFAFFSLCSVGFSTHVVLGLTLAGGKKNPVDRRAQLVGGRERERTGAQQS